MARFGSASTGSIPAKASGPATIRIANRSRVPAKHRGQPLQSCISLATFFLGSLLLSLLPAAVRAQSYEVDPSWTMTTVAGTGTDGFGGDGGPATSAEFFGPRYVAVDGAGNLYISDLHNHRIRKVDASGHISTVAGSGTDGFGGDGGPATSARLSQPHGVAVDGAGNLYIAEFSNHRVRKVDASGRISTVAGRGPVDLDDLGDGRPATSVGLNGPTAIALDGRGSLYIAETFRGRVRKVDSEGTITTVAQALTRTTGEPYGVAADGAGNVYISSGRNVHRVDSMGAITLVAGRRVSMEGRYLRDPTGLELDARGNLYVADYEGGRVVVLKPTADGGGGGVGQTLPDAPRNLRADGRDEAVTLVWDSPEDDGGTAVSDYEYRINERGGWTSIGSTRTTHSVTGLVNGTVYIFRVRAVNRIGRSQPSNRAEATPVARSQSQASYVITTVAGTGTHGFSGDGGPATSAQLRRALGVAVDVVGNLYIADAENLRIRRVDASGTITTVAGTGTHGFSGDGGPAAAAQLTPPAAVKVDGAGNLYIADDLNYRIRKVSVEAPPLISSGGVLLATGTPVVNRISPNSIVTVFGAGFAPAGSALTMQLDDAGGVAVQLGDTCLEIDGNPAPLFAVFPGQINAQVPHETATGEARVAAVRGCATPDERRSAEATIPVASVSPAFFNFVENSDGRNPVVALHGNGPALVGEPGLIPRGLLPGAETRPAAPGEVVTLFGTGFGETVPPLEAGEIPWKALPASRGRTRLANEVVSASEGFWCRPRMSSTQGRKRAARGLMSSPCACRCRSAQAMRRSLRPWTAFRLRTGRTSRLRPVPKRH